MIEKTRCLGSLELVLVSVDGAAVEVLEIVAQTAALRAGRQHALGVGFALTVGSPVLAVLGLILANGGADAASDGALGHHHRGVLDALILQRPHCARRRVGVRTPLFGLARLQAARHRARLEGVARVGDALALLGPSRAVVVRVLAVRDAHLARHGAVLVHEARVGLALTLLAP